jgi:hypothetical protein
MWRKAATDTAQRIIGKRFAVNSLDSTQTNFDTDKSNLSIAALV